MWCSFGIAHESLYVDAAGFRVTCPLQRPRCTSTLQRCVHHTPYDMRISAPDHCMCNFWWESDLFIVHWTRKLKWKRKCIHEWECQAHMLYMGFNSWKGDTLWWLYHEATTDNYYWAVCSNAVNSLHWVTVKNDHILGFRRKLCKCMTKLNTKEVKMQIVSRITEKNQAGFVCVVIKKPCTHNNKKRRRGLGETLAKKAREYPGSGCLTTTQSTSNYPLIPLKMPPIKFWTASLSGWEASTVSVLRSVRSYCWQFKCS